VVNKEEEEALNCNDKFLIGVVKGHKNYIASNWLEKWLKEPEKGKTD
jgi:hypothetical protein